MKKDSSLSRLLPYAGRRKVLTYLSWILSAVSAILALVPFIYIWLILREVLAVAPDYERAVHAAQYGWTAVTYAIVSALVYVGALMCSHLSAFRIASNMQKGLMQHIARLPIGTVEKFGSGQLRRIVTESTKATENYLAHRLPDKAGAIATPIGLLFLLFFFDWRFGLLSLIPVALSFVIVSLMTGARMEQKMNEYQNALGDMAGEAVEYVRGVPVLKTFGQTIFSFRRFKSAIDNYEKWVIAYTKQLRVPMVVFTTLLNSIFAFLIGGAMAFAAGGVTNELLLNLIFYVVITPALGSALTKIMFLSEDGLIVKDALARTDTIWEKAPLPDAGTSAVPSDTSLSFENVTYSYNSQKNAVEDVTMQVQPGHVAALVGPSGGGKTTLAELASRFFDTQKGTIRIGGKDIRDIPQNELVDAISFVSQDSHLLKASILENVRLGKPLATREQVMQALETAQCEDILQKLPHGIDTVVGEDGVHLSGGECQRIAIARAVLKNAPILILDEATAFADPDNELRIQQALAALSRNKTVLMIAHRLTTAADADEIYVLEDGRIAESGSWEQLLAANGLFSRMWDEYTHAVQWKMGKEEAV